MRATIVSGAKARDCSCGALKMESQPKSKLKAERAKKYRKEHKKRKSMKERMKSDKVKLKEEVVCWKKRANELQRYVNQLDSVSDIATVHDL